MMRTLKRKVRTLVNGHDISTFFFSQSGEDGILQNIFQKKLLNKDVGFYVDIGAHHPTFHSNTHLFYLNGWRGINIDACPGTMNPFNKLRQRDINLEVGIGEKEGLLTWHMSPEHPTMNSFSKENMLENGILEECIDSTRRVEVVPLKKILSHYQEQFSKIDFISIDVEGFELEVLQSNDWELFSPSVVAVELRVHSINDVLENVSAQFLMNKGYELIAKTFIAKYVATVFFVHKDFDY